jgi:hypothetical protein
MPRLVITHSPTYMDKIPTATATPGPRNDTAPRSPIEHASTRVKEPFAQVMHPTALLPICDVLQRDLLPTPHLKHKSTSYTVRINPVECPKSEAIEHLSFLTFAACRDLLAASAAIFVNGGG